MPTTSSAAAPPPSELSATRTVAQTEPLSLAVLAEALEERPAAVPAAGSVVVDYEAAWALLESRKSVDPAALAAVLDELGLETAEDLRYLEAEDIARISSLLKKVPQMKFRELLHGKG